MYDSKQNGWGGSIKFIDADVIEFCELQSSKGNKDFDRMAHDSLLAGLKLIDPAWGGVYQYSTDGDWDHPHFEKIMSYQTDDLRTYARAYLVWKDEKFLQAAQSIHRYLTTFLLSPDGAFYTSQDADLVDGEHSGEYFKLNDADRRKLGVPRIDTHIYARENGWAISSLCAYYAATGDADALSQATRAADWIIANRSRGDGGFNHDAKDVAGPYLGDTLAMGRAFLALVRSNGRSQMDSRSSAAGSFIEKTFVNSVASAPLEDQVALTRFERLLFQYTGEDTHQKLAEATMKYLATPQVTDNRHWLVGGILSADFEMANDPVHVTVVGPKSDARAKDLFRQQFDIHSATRELNGLMPQKVYFQEMKWNCRN